LSLGELIGARTEAIHVTEAGTQPPVLLASDLGVPLRVCGGSVRSVLLDAFGDPAVAMAVLGARHAESGRRPAGLTALHLVERTDKPVVVVPPETAQRGRRRIRRLVLPLEGSDESSLPVMQVLSSVIVSPVDLIVLHVFTPATLPKTMDRPVRDLEMWSGEFLARYGPPDARVECRTGEIADEITHLATTQRADLVVLSWSRDASSGHALVARAVVGQCALPVLLLPVRTETRSASDRDL
jgi:Universal stress protein family